MINSNNFEILSIQSLLNRSLLRYNIVNDQDLREATRKKQAYLERQNGMVGDMAPRHAEVIPFRQTQGESSSS